MALLGLYSSSAECLTEGGRVQRLPGSIRSRGPCLLEPSLFPASDQKDDLLRLLVHFLALERDVELALFLAFESPLIHFLMPSTVAPG